MTPLKVGVLGCGMILRTYLETIAQLPGVEIVACADLVPARAESVANANPGMRAVTDEALLTDPEVDLILNLTIPAAHYATTKAALAAGKHVYVEKPLATTVPQARELVELAAARNLRLGVAPDTVLGSGIQTARAVVDSGEVGRPLGAAAFFVGSGPDNYHATPGFFFSPGGGPLLDMGPYYVTSLVTLLGPVQRVSALASSPRPVRTSTGGPNAGNSFEVAVPTHVSATLEHTSGVLSTLLCSFDAIGGSNTPRIEVYGESGTVAAPDPNRFDGEVDVRSHADEQWAVAGVRAGAEGGARGIGLADLAGALAHGGPHRASAELGLHVLDVLTSVETAAATSCVVPLTTTCVRPEPMPLLPLTEVGR